MLLSLKAVEALLNPECVSHWNASAVSIIFGWTLSFFRQHLLISTDRQGPAPSKLLDNRTCALFLRLAWGKVSIFLRPRRLLATQSSVGSTKMGQCMIWFSLYLWTVLGCYLLTRAWSWLSLIYCYITKQQSLTSSAALILTKGWICVMTL